MFGFALHIAQMGERHPDSKPLKGFGGAGVLEVVEDFVGSTYRAVYTVKFAGVVYALHAFQKKAGVESRPRSRKSILSEGGFGSQRTTTANV